MLGTVFFFCVLLCYCVCGVMGYKFAMSVNLVAPPLVKSAFHDIGMCLVPKPPSATPSCAHAKAPPTSHPSSRLWDHLGRVVMGRGKAIGCAAYVESHAGLHKNGIFWFGRSRIAPPPPKGPTPLPLPPFPILPEAHSALLCQTCGCFVACRNTKEFFSNFSGLLSKEEDPPPPSQPPPRIPIPPPPSLLSFQCSPAARAK